MKINVTNDQKKSIIDGSMKSIITQNYVSKTSDVLLCTDINTLFENDFANVNLIINQIKIKNHSSGMSYEIYLDGVLYLEYHFYCSIFNNNKENSRVDVFFKSSGFKSFFDFHQQFLNTLGVVEFKSNLITFSILNILK